MTHPDLEKDFFGREKVLDLLKRRVLDLKDNYRQNVAIVGDQYVGKSALLKYFLANFDDPDVIQVYLDLEHKDFSYFFLKFAGSLLYNFARTKQLPLNDDLLILLETTRNVIPMTTRLIEEIKGYVQHGKISDAFIGLLTLTEVFSYETGKFTMLILDEFQYLEDLEIPHVFQILGKHIMTKKKCFYLVSSSNPSVARKILSERLSLLFGNFETIELLAFDLATSQKFIEHHLKGVKIGAQLSNFLTDFTGGYPLYLKLLCQDLINLSAIHKQDEVYMPILAQAVENSLFDRWGVISRHFELILNELAQIKGPGGFPALLMSLANGRNKIDELLKDLDVQRKHLLQKINRLIERGLVVKNGNSYYLKDKFLKYWIKFVYQKRLKDVDFTLDKQRKRFRDEFNRCVEEFKVSSRKDFSSRVMELLHCFDNEAFDLNGRRYKLPIFRDTAPYKIRNAENGGSIDIIKASTDETTWFVIIKKDNFVESDVSAILKEAKASGQKLERCLIVSLTDLDENARLRALQERFWIWNESELNTILTLFDKPYIVR